MLVAEGAWLKNCLGTGFNGDVLIDHDAARFTFAFPREA
jgi:hypothetical protein